NDGNGRRRRRRRNRRDVIRAFTIVLALASAAFAGASLTQVATIDLSGVEGRLDHFAADPDGHHVFVAALGNNSLEIIHTTSNKHLTSIPGLKKPTGIAVIAKHK